MKSLLVLASVDRHLESTFLTLASQAGREILKSEVEGSIITLILKSTKSG